MTDKARPRAFAIDTEAERLARVLSTINRLNQVVEDIANGRGELHTFQIELKYELTMLVLSAQADVAIRQAEMGLESWLRNQVTKEEQVK